jgi:hypothetical protein
MKQGKENNVDEVIVDSMIWMEREIQHKDEITLLREYYIALVL